MTFKVEPEVRYTPKKAWDPDRIKGAWIIANVSQIILAEIMHDTINKGRDPSGRSFGQYARSRTPRGYRLPPDFPNAPAGSRTLRSGPQKGWHRYENRFVFERLAGRDPNQKRFILSGAMWQSLTIAVKNETRSRLYFRGSSKARSGGKTQNRTKARMIARAHGGDVLAVSDVALREVQKFLASSVGPFLFQDALAKAARRKPRRKQARTESRLRSSIGVLQNLSLVNHAKNAMTGGGGAAALKLPF